ncbi:MAG: DUF58 domain-containing protein [Nitrospirota bacterium]
MAVSGIVGRRNLSGIEVAIGLPGELYAHTESPVSITITNSRRFLPAFLIRVRFGEQEKLFPYVEAKGREVRHTILKTGKRGLHRIGALRVSSVFPFNFFIRYKRIPLSLEMVVFPALKGSVLRSSLDVHRNVRGEYTAASAGQEGEMISLRDYTYGDPLKYIHWKSSAKTGKLKTKELSALSSQPVIIDIEGVPIRNIEDRLSCIAYTIVQLIRKNTPVGLKVNTTLYNPDLSQEHKRTLLKALALYGIE